MLRLVFGRSSGETQRHAMCAHELATLDTIVQYCYTKRNHLFCPILLAICRTFASAISASHCVFPLSNVNPPGTRRMASAASPTAWSLRDCSYQHFTLLDYPPCICRFDQTHCAEVESNARLIATRLKWERSVQSPRASLED